MAGDAALLFDPEDTGAMDAALARLLDDNRLRQRLRAAGPVRAASFTWEATAGATAEVYRRLLSDRRSPAPGSATPRGTARERAT